MNANDTDFAAETTTQAAAPAAKEVKVFDPASIKTSKHAKHLLALAEARLVKANAEVTKEQELIVVLTGLVDTLPESITPSAAPKVVKAVGDAVHFNYGREDNRKVYEGTVKAIKANDAGHPAQYLVEVGEGFDTKQYKIFPGQIVGNEEQEQEPVEDLDYSDNIDDQA